MLSTVANAATTGYYLLGGRLLTLIPVRATIATAARLVRPAHRPELTSRAQPFRHGIRARSQNSSVLDSRAQHTDTIREEE
jgi:hypothetical protein